mmetsp:Transcript_9727/g.10930  ORF Transcript_9727/g.10930 Transcript_9727/m.10930 type:complete len:93 (+) Transcript_9727:369-647(+)
MLYLGMFIKKVFMIMKYIDAYDDIQTFLQTSFSMISISEIKTKINSSPKKLGTIADELIDSMVDIFESSETSQKSVEKVHELQSELRKLMDE